MARDATITGPGAIRSISAGVGSVWKFLNCHLKNSAPTTSSKRSLILDNANLKVIFDEEAIIESVDSTIEELGRFTDGELVVGDVAFTGEVASGGLAFFMADRRSGRWRCAVHPLR